MWPYLRFTWTDYENSTDSFFGYQTAPYSKCLEIFRQVWLTHLRSYSPNTFSGSIARCKGSNDATTSEFWRVGQTVNKDENRVNLFLFFSNESLYETNKAFSEDEKPTETAPVSLGRIEEEDEPEESLA